MARPGVTYQAVSAAANQLLGQGKNPTIEHIRHLLGTGSSTTLANHLRNWKEQLRSGHALASKEHLPEELQALVKGLWERIFAQTEEKISSLELEHRQQLDVLQAELQKYKKNNQRWQQLHNLWAEEKNLLRKDKLQAEKTAQQVQQDCAALSEKQAVLLDQLQEKQDRIKELNRLHHQLQANLEHFRESARTQRLVEQQRHENEKQEFQAQIKELKAQQLLLRNEASKFEKQRQNMQKTQEVLEERMADLKTLQEKQAKQALDAQTESRVLAAQLQQAERRLMEAGEEKQRLGQEKWRLANEKAQLEGQLKQMQSFLKITEPLGV